MPPSRFPTSPTFGDSSKMSGSSVFAATAPKPTALYEFKDQDTFLLEVRAQRDF
jgi:hypothetical protein